MFTQKEHTDMNQEAVDTLICSKQLKIRSKTDFTNPTEPQIKFRLFRSMS